MVRERFTSIKMLGEKTMEQLSDEDICWSYNGESNSIAVIVKHMSGNMISRWTDFLETDGEKPDRNRDMEFSEDMPTKSELMQVWQKGWDCLLHAITNLSEEDLVKKVSIRGESHSVIEAMERQVSHYSYHIGQMVYLGKMIKNDQWKSLSIPKGQSEEYLKQMLEKHGK
ncbi:Protein of unknown function [Gracilibacillus ureilyticus]|uniref:DUF1572 domain-containing protein n=1 Tax=Gracilibacillus ureilyticus TaxID=531814 RepID=A0A1H9VA95_9BACI|nr:Protein of unknown function [Gracilibacillus ureilyticus]